MVANSRTPVRTHRLRPLNLPRAVSVVLNERGLPIAIIRDGKRKEVEKIGEIWRVDDEWWRDPIARRYVETILEGGRRLVVYEDQITGEWFEQR